VLQPAMINCAAIVRAGDSSADRWCRDLQDDFRKECAGYRSQATHHMRLRLFSHRFRTGTNINVRMVYHTISAPSRSFGLVPPSAPFMQPDSLCKPPFAVGELALIETRSR